MREIPLDHAAAGLRIGVAAARFNERHVRRLVDGALATLREQGAADDAVALWWVPGSLELPLAARWMAAAGFDAVVALGVIVEGETEHFRLVADQCARGLVEVSLATGIPVTNGVLACHDATQAEARSGGAMGNAGSAAALAAVAMARLSRAGGMTR